MFMNTWEIDEALQQHRDHPVLGPATQTLASLRDAANENSDGWAIWPKPSRAAKQLMELIHGPSGTRPWDTDRDDATPEKLKAAYKPLKSFRTRSGIHFEIVEN